MKCKNMPQEALDAYNLANELRGLATGVQNRARPKQTDKHSYRLTAEYQAYLADEKEWREYRQSKTKQRDEVRAIAARTYLHTQDKPRLTAKRQQIAQVKEAADKASIARARTPKRRLEAMVRHMNTTCYEILKARGIR